LKAGKRETRPVTADGHEWVRLTRSLEVGGERDGWAPPVSGRTKKKKGRGLAGPAGLLGGPRGPTARTSAREKEADGLVVSRAEEKGKEKRNGPRGEGFWDFSF
jgi:hypothetical protein